MKVFFSGDVFGEVGKKAIIKYLPEYRQSHKIDFAIVNGENVTQGLGINFKDYQDLLKAGVDVVSGGNHSFRQKDILNKMNNEAQLIRPANLPKKYPGRGFTIREIYAGIEVAVVNLMGRLYIDVITSPLFEKADEIITELKSCGVKNIIVDIHAETASEKRALAWYLDGRVSLVVGTHTHVPTADDEILPGGTAYLTDAGMTGPYDSVIGMRKEQVLAKMGEATSERFQPASKDVRLSALIIDIDENSGKARSIERIHRRIEV